MSSLYLCPHCRTLLNPRNEIIMILSRKDSRDLVLFSPEPGNYTIYKADHISFTNGEVVEFLCPACHRSLNSQVSDEFGEVLRREKDGTLSRVNFSRVYGKHATFIIGDEGVKSFGDDASNYQDMNWFGAGRSWDNQL